MGNVILLLALCVVMAVASFLAGALPLSMSLSQSQLRLITSLGVGILVGTSLIVIIPEGIEAAASSPVTPSHAHMVRTLAQRSPWNLGIQSRDILDLAAAAVVARTSQEGAPSAAVTADVSQRSDEHDERDDTKSPEAEPKEDDHHVEIPGLEVGFSMILGFILMFLIDRLPKHASESLQSGPQPQHFSLDNLGGAGSVPRTSVDEEEGFLGSLAPSPKHTRSLATTIGLIIHAAADGIAMGASSATSNTKLGIVIFIAIMIHKAPAAFGLTSLLLKQGLSKRAARGHLIVFSLAAPIGAVSTWLLIKLLGGGEQHHDDEGGVWWTGMLLLFSGGTFLYVAMHAMQEEGSHGNDVVNGYAESSPPSQRRAKGPEIRDTLATVVGMLLPLLTQFGHHHH